MHRKRPKRFHPDEPGRTGLTNDKFGNLRLSDLVSVKEFAQGSWGRLELVHIKHAPSRCFALKKIHRSKLTASAARQNVYNEKEILSEIKSDFIVKFHKTFHNRTHLYILTEWCPGGDLSVRGRFSETASLFYAGCIVEALDYLHSKNIVHRDLKLRNFVLDRRGYLKLIDFGVAKKLGSKDGRTRTFCGTLKYCAPEMLEARKSSLTNGYVGYAVDLWALGLVIFEFLHGLNPMSSPNPRTVCQKIMAGIDAVAFPAHVSQEAGDFIKKLCKKNPEERLGYGTGGFENLRNHSWFRKLDVEALRSKTLPAPSVPTLEGVTDTRYFTAQVSDEATELLEAEVDPAWANDF